MIRSDVIRAGVWAWALGLMVCAPALAQSPWTSTDPAASMADRVSWWLLVEDLDCAGCRAEVYLDGALVVMHPSGGEHLLVDLEGAVRPGSTEVMVFIRGPRGSGRMAVSVARGRVRHEVVVFDPDVTRYALQPEPTPAPLRFTVPARR